MIPIAGPNPYAELYDNMDRQRIQDTCNRYMSKLEKAAVQRIINGEKRKSEQDYSARKRALNKCKKHLSAMTSALPKMTCSQTAKLYCIDRSTVLRHSHARKMGKIWQIDNIEYQKPYPKFSKTYSESEIDFIRSHPFWAAQEIANKIGRSANSVRIKKYRMKKAR